MMLASPPCYSSMAPLPQLEDALSTLLRSPTPGISITSCSQEAALTTFDWSDFPTIVDHSELLSDSSSAKKEYMSYIPFLQQQSSYSYSCSDERRPTAINVSYSQSRYGAPRKNSVTNITESQQSQLPQTEKNTSKKSVSFSTFVHVRTHDVALGDHPCCQGGMALSLDWTRVSDDEEVPMETYESASMKRRSHDFRLTFPQRRDRLEAATGLRGFDLLRQEYELIFGWSPKGLHTSPSVRRALAAARGLDEYRFEEEK